MRLGFISDIHMDVNKNFEVKENILNVCIDKQIEYLIIAGDFASDFFAISYFIDYIQRNSDIKVRFVPGNHDLYTCRGKNSKEIYNELITMEECLVNNPLIINDYAIVGNTGWYDYSFKDTAFTDEMLKRKRYRGYTWADRTHFKWDELNDYEINDIFLRHLEKQLDKYSNKNIIAVTHTVPFNNFVQYKQLDPSWNYFSAFIGSRDMGDLYKKYPVKMAVFGHTHNRQRKEVEGIDCICSPLGNYYEFIDSSDMYTEIKKTMRIVDAE